MDTDNDYNNGIENDTMDHDFECVTWTSVWSSENAIASLRLVCAVHGTRLRVRGRPHERRITNVRVWTRVVHGPSIEDMQHGHINRIENPWSGTWKSRWRLSGLTFTSTARASNTCSMARHTTRPTRRRRHRTFYSQTVSERQHGPRTTTLEATTSEQPKSAGDQATTQRRHHRRHLERRHRRHHLRHLKRHRHRRPEWPQN